MTAPSDKTIKALLLRHLLLIRAPIPILLADHLDAVHMLNRSANLQVDLLLWRNAEAYPAQLVEQLEQVQQQVDTPAPLIQQKLVTLVEAALQAL